MAASVMRASMLTPQATFLLNSACWPVRVAFDSCPYLVGSALVRPDFRDVDVRTILDDDRFAAIFPGYTSPWTDPLWSLVCTSISRQLTEATGLPVDYQIQPQTEANEQYGGPFVEGTKVMRRHALALFPQS